MIKNYLKLIRAPQWIKNLFVFVPLLFSKHFFDKDYFILSLAGFAIFCLTSSLVYIVNDIIDIEADRAHPVKKERPLPSGKISKKQASITAFILFLIIIFSGINFNPLFLALIGSYLILNLFYSLKWKHIVLVDIFCIAAGFMIRVIAGAYIIEVEISSWLLLTTMFISLFLAIMKRKSELSNSQNIENSANRKVLTHYSLDFTNQISTIAASAVIICYALYTVSQRTVAIFGNENLIYTTPFVVFGIFRYMYLVYMNQQGENTTEIIITDLPMIFNIIFYILVTTLIVYKIF